MGRLILLLVVVNAVVLLAGLSLELLHGQSPAPLGFNAVKLRLLGRVEPASVSVATSRPRVTDLARCLYWPDLDDDLLGEIESRLHAASLSTSEYDILLQPPLGWWVYLPPFVDVAAMQSAIVAATLKGVKVITPVRSGKFARAVSLGVFPTQASARAEMERLSRLGVQGVRMGPQGGGSEGAGPKSGGASLIFSDTVAQAKLSGFAENWSQHAPLPCAAPGAANLTRPPEETGARTSTR